MFLRYSICTWYMHDTYIHGTYIHVKYIEPLCTAQVHSRVIPYVKSSNPCNPPFRFFWNFYQWLMLVWVDKTRIFSLIQFELSDLWSVKDGPCRPLPGGQKLHFHLAALHRNCNILKTLCQIKLKINNFLSFRVLNQNWMVKRD